MAQEKVHFPEVRSEYGRIQPVFSWKISAGLTFCEVVVLTCGFLCIPIQEVMNLNDLATNLASYGAQN